METGGLHWQSLVPRQRFLNMPDEARRRLLDLAIQEFAERGFDEASLNDILARAGISKGAYYYYFDDKEDLFATAIESSLDAALSRLPLPTFDDLTAREFWPAVERSVEHWSAAYDSSRDLVRASVYVNEARRRSPRFKTILARTQAFWRTLVLAGQRLGCVRRDVPVDHLIRLIEANDIVLDTVLLTAKTKLSRSAFEKHIRLVLDTFKRLLVIESPSHWARPSARARPRRG
jgi:AcrR family transcriptional regulator